MFYCIIEVVTGTCCLLGVAARTAYSGSITQRSVRIWLVLAHPPRNMYVPSLFELGPHNLELISELNITSVLLSCDGSDVRLLLCFAIRTN